MPATTITKPRDRHYPKSSGYHRAPEDPAAPIGSARRRRGIRLYRRFAGSIRRVAQDTYLVPSQTGAGLYLVYAAEGKESCQCPDFRRHSRRDSSGKQTFLCKHYHAVRLFRASAADCAGCGAELLTIALSAPAADGHRRCVHCAKQSPAHGEPAARLAS